MIGIVGNEVIPGRRGIVVRSEGIIDVDYEQEEIYKWCNKRYLSQIKMSDRDWFLTDVTDRRTG